MAFSAEVASSCRACGLRIPLEYSEFRIAALNDKPVIWVVGYPAAYFATEFLERCHALALAS
jgi:hypothetical protein